MDLIDLMKPREDMYCRGWYYMTVKADNPLDGGMVFNYDFMDEKSKGYDVTENIQYTGKRVRLITRDKLPFKVKRYIKTQDGEWWQIVEITERTEHRETLRFLKSAPDTRYIISVISVDNPWELQGDETYDSAGV